MSRFLLCLIGLLAIASAAKADSPISATLDGQSVPIPNSVINFHVVGPREMKSLNFTVTNTSTKRSCPAFS